MRLQRFFTDLWYIHDARTRRQPIESPRSEELDIWDHDWIEEKRLHLHALYPDFESYH